MADEESPRTAATWRRTASHRKSYGTSQRTFEFLRLASSCWLWSCLPASKRSRRWPSSTCCLGTPQLHSPGVDIKGAKATGAHSWVRSCGRQLRLRGCLWRPCKLTTLLHINRGAQETQAEQQLLQERLVVVLGAGASESGPRRRPARPEACMCVKIGTVLDVYVTLDPGAKKPGQNSLK